MCKIANHPDEYQKTIEILRLYGIREDSGAGFELLRKAIVMYYVENKGNDENYLFSETFLEKLKDGMVIPGNKFIAEKLERINRDIAIQWMIEAIKCSDILDFEDIPESFLKQFIEHSALKL